MNFCDFKRVTRRNCAGVLSKALMLAASWPRRLRHSLACALLPLSLMPGVAAEEAPQSSSTFSYDVSIYHNSVSGPGAAQSTLPRGSHFLGDFNYSLQTSVKDDQFSLRFHSRATDDRTIDSHTWALNNLQLKLWNERRQWEAGDVYADFSQYSFSSSLKGVRLSQKVASGQTEWNVISGFAYPRWESFWGGSQYKAIRRAVHGLNVRNASGAWSYGFTSLQTKDSDRISTYDPLYNNRIMALNWEYAVKEGMTLKGESAFSSGDMSAAAGEATVGQHGNAHQLLWTHNLRHRRWAYEYERVSPGFVTLTGSAIADRERMKLNYRHGLDADTSLQFGLVWFHDKLGGSPKTDRTDVYQPELVLMLNSPFRRPDATLDLRLGADRRYDSSTSTLDRHLGLTYRDILGMVDWELNVENATFSTKPYDSGSRSNEINIFTSLATRLEKDGVVWRPSLNVGWWRNRNVLEAYSDRMFETSLGLGYDNAAAKFTANLRLGKKHSYNEKIDDASRWFLSLNLEAQPAYLKMLGLGPDAKQYLRIMLNDYKYDTAGNNYRETCVITGIKVGL